MKHIDRPAATLPSKSIKPEELITFDELQAGWNCTEKTIKDALKKQRLFSVPNSAGEECYPAFFTQTKKYGRGKLGEVVQCLRGISNSSKYDFFVSKSPYLNGLTPLEALEQKKIYAALSAAVSFALETYPLEKRIRH